MGKKKKPLWVKFLIAIFSIVLSIGIAFGAFFAVLYFAYNINIFEVINQVNVLNQEVDLNKLAPNSFSINDMQSSKVITDSNINGLISFSEEDGYTITFENVSSVLTSETRFSDKQIGAIIDNLISSITEINVDIGSTVNLKEYGFKVIQVDFLNITEKTTDFNVVVKIDLAKVKEQMTNFPLNLLKDKIPDTLYFSSTVTITKGENAFEYTTQENSLLINNLTAQQTDSIFNTLNNFIKLGTAKEFSKIIGDAFVNTLIGTEENPGFAYILKDIGVTDFSFTTEDNMDYFVLNK